VAHSSIREACRREAARGSIEGTQLGHERERTRLGTLGSVGGWIVMYEDMTILDHIVLHQLRRYYICHDCEP
jgi:hypothetical protein